MNYDKNALVSRDIVLTFPGMTVEQADNILSQLRTIVTDAGGTWKEGPAPAPSSHADDSTTGSLLDSVLGGLYASHGDTEAMILKTSAELAFEVEDMCDAPVASIASWLFDHRFQTKVMNDMVCWILYEKNCPAAVQDE